MTIDVESFIRSGKLGDVRLGMTKNELVGLLGAADAVAGGGRAPEILKYPDVEVMVKGGVVTFISITLPPAHWGDAQYLGWRPSHDTTRSECEHFFRLNQIAIDSDQRATRGSFRTLVVKDSGVRLAFVDDLLDRIYAMTED